jgi:hypothetical protein
MEDINKFREIQNAVDHLLNVKSVAKRKKKNENDKKREIFFQLINSIDQINVRQALLFADLRVDFSTYDEKFFEVIDGLIQMSFGKQCSDLIGFYLYDRFNTDGSMNPILTEDGRELYLKDPYELWDLMKLINKKIVE